LAQFQTMRADLEALAVIARHFDRALRCGQKELHS
jgi:hypothetical protein